MIEELQRAAIEDRATRERERRSTFSSFVSTFFDIRFLNIILKVKDTD